MNENNEQLKEPIETVTKAIEKHVPKLPSDLFFWGAGGVLALSLAAKLLWKNGKSPIAGHWAPTLFALGLYNKFTEKLGLDHNDLNESKKSKES